MPHEFLRRLGIQHPIAQAPLGGVPSVELAAAVSNAGALGALGAAYLTPDQLRDQLRAICGRTRGPFMVNLFAGGWDAHATGDATRMLAILAEVHERLGIPPPTLAALPPDPFPAQLDAVLEAPPAVFGFTFGVPPPDAMARLRAAGTSIWGTATTVDEARLLADAGADAVVAQGVDAGGHRGTFAGRAEDATVPTLALVEAIARAVPLPVIASGGLMDGADVAAALRAGAVAASLGTVFLACPESGASAPYKAALLAARRDTTTLTRAFSGRLARGLENAFIARLRAEPGAILPYPLQNALTRPMRTAAAARGDADGLSLWAGTGVARLRSLPAAELVRTLVAELDAASR